MVGQADKPVPVTDWLLRYDDVSAPQEGLREALCTLGNGYFATRGAAPESHADGVHYSGTYIAGCFNALQTVLAGRTTENESLVNAPNWLGLTFRAGDGPWLGAGGVTFLDDRQELDLRRGVLTRRRRVRDDLGHITRITHRRFVHMGAAHLAALEMTITPENWTEQLRIRSELDGTVTNSGVPRDRELASRHLLPVETRCPAAESMLLVVETCQPRIRIAEAARTRVFKDGAWLAGPGTVTERPGWIGREFAISASEGEKVTVETTVAIATSRDRAVGEAGHAGAMYPWQSASDGTEQSALIHLNPQSGRWTPDTTYRQRHVGIAVAYNVWQYYQSTGDRGFLARYGAEMLLEIARFFASIATYDRRRDRYVIRGVVGPDEFHTSYPGSPGTGIDNNAYTNVMTAWLLQRAIEVLDVLPAHRRTELAETLDLTASEQERWEHISRRLYVPFHGDGLISQFEGYEKLADLDWEDYRARYGNIRRLDRILEAEGDDPNRYKVSKQADVLMLFYLLPASELSTLLCRLGYAWSPSRIPATIDYYLARTSEGSTLSAVVHAWVLTRANRKRSFEEFLDALRSDVADVQGGTTAEGIHLAAMAGTIDVLQRCFAGAQTRDDALWLDPYWPERLGTLEFSVLCRQHQVTLAIRDHTVVIRSGPGALTPIRVGCRGQVRELSNGQTLQFTL